jgi:amino acid adenylation domain-containing protein
MSVNYLPSKHLEPSRSFDFSMSLYDLFEIQVKNCPDKTAIVDNDGVLTFLQLSRSINNLSTYLSALGIDIGTHVGISISRSRRSIISVFALLKLGAVFVPLDPGYPQNRLNYMIEDSNVKFILAARELNVNGFPHADKLIIIDDHCSHMTEPQQDLKSRYYQAIYLLYTSGSTGTPKGLLGSHIGLLNRCHWMWEAYPFNANDVCSHKTTLNFVDSLWEIFGSLLKGIPLVVINESDAKNIRRFKNSLNNNGVTRLVLVPSLLEALLADEEKLKHLKICICSGEALLPHLACRFKQAYSNVKLLNLYGSTEVTGDVTYYDLDLWSVEESSVPIGKPISNTFAYVLDDNMNSVPIDTEGKLFVSGLNIALGYWKKPDETKIKFSHDSKTNTAMYCMDDWVKFRSDGNIEYLGRHDDQIKIRGVRVELGEIKNTLLKHPQVKNAAVRAVKKVNNTLLIGYVVSTHNGDKTQLSQKLMHFLAENLPSPYIPNAILVVNEFSLTPNGKVDMKMLPDIQDFVP